MLFDFSKIKYKKLLLSIFVFGIIFSSSPKKVEAIFGVGDIVTDPGHTIETIAQTAIDAENATQNTLQTANYWFKELVMDTVFYLLNDVLIAQLSQSIVNWINSGFEGKPAFVQDLKKHLEQVESEIFGAFLDEFGLGYMCSSFSNQLKRTFELEFALAQGGAATGNSRINRFRNGASCTVEDALSNIGSSLEDFQNDFSNGGFEALVELGQPQNNRYGAYLTLRNELFRRQNEAVKNQKAELSFGQGFLSFKRGGDCLEYDYVEYGGDTGDGPEAGGFDQVCTRFAPEEIVSPGQVVEEKLNSNLSIGDRRIAVADEINEILAALLQQLVQQLIGPGGLLGLSEDGSGSDGGSFTDDLGNASSDNGDLLEDQIERTLEELEEYPEHGNQELNMLYGTRALLFSLQSCYERGERDRGIDYSGELSQVNDELIDINEDILEETQNLLDAEILLQEFQDILDRGVENLTQEELNDLTLKISEASRKFNPTRAENDNVQLDLELNGTGVSGDEGYNGEIRDRIQQCQIRNDGLGGFFP